MDYAGVMLFSLIFMRMTGFVYLNPVLGRQNVSAYVKNGIVIVLSVLLFSYTSQNVSEVNTVIEYTVLLLKEFIIGYVLGLVFNIFLYMLIFAGDFLDMQMGLSMARVYDSTSNINVSITTSIFTNLIYMIFFASGAFESFMKILIYAEEIIPYGSVRLTPDLLNPVIGIFLEYTALGIKFAFPIFAAEFLGEIAVGILMKTIPQINVFVVNIQTKVLIGLALLIVFFYPMANMLDNSLALSLEYIMDVLNSMS